MSLSRRHFLSAAAAAPFLAGPLVAQERVAMSSGRAASKHALTPAIRFATAAQTAAEGLSDYSATLIKRERVNGELKEGRMLLKFRPTPTSVYLKFITPHEGREVIYVEGRNGGNMLVHETGLASLMGTLKVDPKGSLALKESRHPVTSIGMEMMARKVATQWNVERVLPAPEIKFYPNATLGKTDCKVVETTHAVPNELLKAQRTRLYVAKDTGLPVRVQQYAFPSRGQKPVLVEDYTYTDVRTNLGMGAIDFNTKNPNYGF